MNRRWTLFALGALLAGLAAGARAQNKDEKKREGQLRTVHGAVVDKEEGGLGGAVVYLKNVKTQTVKTHIAEKDGTYRFSGLDPNVDYEIHAAHQER